MEHIHNEAVLAFLKAHQNRPGVRRFIAEQDKEVKALNCELGTRYGGYLDYLEANIGDDASFTLEELKALSNSPQGRRPRRACGNSLPRRLAAPGQPVP